MKTKIISKAKRKKKFEHPSELNVVPLFCLCAMGAWKRFPLSREDDTVSTKLLTWEKPILEPYLHASRKNLQLNHKLRDWLIPILKQKQPKKFFSSSGTLISFSEKTLFHQNFLNCFVLPQFSRAKQPNFWIWFQEWTFSVPLKKPKLWCNGVLNAAPFLLEKWSD